MWMDGGRGTLSFSSARRDLRVHIRRPSCSSSRYDSRRAEGEKNSFVRRLIARHDARPDAARTAAAARSKRKINVQRPPDGIL